MEPDNPVAFRQISLPDGIGNRVVPSLLPLLLLGVSPNTDAATTSVGRDHSHHQSGTCTGFGSCQAEAAEPTTSSDLVVDCME